MRNFILIALLGLPFAARAQGRAPAPAWTPYAVEVSSTFAFRGVEDDHGGFYLIWPHTISGETALWAQHVNAQGQLLWTEAGTSLADGLPLGSSWQAVSDGQSGLLVTWENGAEVLAQRFDGDHKAMWPVQEGSLSESTTTRKTPFVAPDGEGGAYVVWQERYMPDRWVLMAQHVNALGARLWHKGGLRVSRRPSEQRNPRAVFDGAAGLVVAWQDYRASASQLQVQRLDYQGTRRWGEEGLLVTAPAGDPARPPYVGAVGKGSAVLAWQASSSAADHIFLQLVDATGRFSWGSRGKELSVGPWHEWNPVLHGDGDGGTWIGWEDARASGQWHVYLQHFLFNGQPAWQGGELLLTPTDADQGRLAIAEDTQGGVFAAWVDNRLGTVGIYLQKVNSKGQKLLGNEGFTVIDHLSNPQTPQVVGLTAEKAVMIWADSPSKGRWSLFWKPIDTLSPTPK
jgi:hypothetical protein